MSLDAIREGADAIRQQYREEAQAKADRQDAIREQVFDLLSKSKPLRERPVTFRYLQILFRAKPERQAELRYVLSAMVEAGLVKRIPSEPGTPGRPTVRYQYVA